MLELNLLYSYCLFHFVKSNFLHHTISQSINFHVLISIQHQVLIIITHLKIPILKRHQTVSQIVDKLLILKKIDFLINQSGLNCLKRANIRYLIPKKCSFLYFSVRNIKGCDKADLKNRLCQQPERS